MRWFMKNKKRMIKLVSFCVTLSMATTTFTGCGGGKSDDGESSGGLFGKKSEDIKSAEPDLTQFKIEIDGNVVTYDMVNDKMKYTDLENALDSDEYSLQFTAAGKSLAFGDSYSWDELGVDKCSDINITDDFSFYPGYTSVIVERLEDRPDRPDSTDRRVKIRHEAFPFNVNNYSDNNISKEDAYISFSSYDTQDYICFTHFYEPYPGTIFFTGGIPANKATCESVDLSTEEDFIEYFNKLGFTEYTQDSDAYKATQNAIDNGVWEGQYKAYFVEDSTVSAILIDLDHKTFFTAEYSIDDGGLSINFDIDIEE